MRQDGPYYIIPLYFFEKLHDNGDNPHTELGMFRYHQIIDYQKNLFYKLETEIDIFYWLHFT